MSKNSKKCRKIIETGNILFANLKLSGQNNALYYFDKKGSEGHYDKNGKSVKKALMKTPINGARLSSPFGMRKHPILGYNKKHMGTDFAAPAGTPIMASGDGKVIRARLATVGGVPVTDLINAEKLKEIEDRTRVAGGEIVKLFGNGSAFYAPAQSAIEMAESYIRDKKRVIPCASLCEGEFGIDGYFIGVPTVIGSNGVEKILEFSLNDDEKTELNKTLEAVKKTVAETEL